jgi:hypothetical protein
MDRDGLLTKGGQAIVREMDDLAWHIGRQEFPVAFWLGAWAAPQFQVYTAGMRALIRQFRFRGTDPNGLSERGPKGYQPRPGIGI